MKPVICGDDALHITTQGCSDCDQLEQRVEVLEDCCHDVTNALNSKLEANNIVAGANITVTQSGKNVTINSTGGGGDLTNYYTKMEVDELLSDIEGMEFVLVDTLPATGQSGKMYLLKRAGTTDRDEYIWVNNAWELIGDTAVDLTNYYNKTEVNNLLNNKVDKVTGKGLSTNDYTTAEKNKLAGIAAGAEVNVQSDWNQTDATKDDFIKNKPANATQAKDGFMSKTDKKKLDEIEEGAEVNVQADWNQTDSTKDDFIKNKPDLSEFLTCDTLSDCRGYFTGAADITVNAGDAFDPRSGVSAFDKDGTPTDYVVIPNTVDTSAEGTYQLVYLAEGTDPVIRTVTVVEPVTQAYAYIDTSTNEMHFFRDEENKYTDGQVEGTKTYYTGFETGGFGWRTKASRPTKIVFDAKISPLTTARWFNDFSNVTSVENPNLLDTSSVTNMASMFASCSSLTTLDASGWDTSSVDDMSSMFAYCSSLATLDVSVWDTSSVTNMASMFASCSSLTTLDASGWDTSSVTNMASMFAYCSSLATLDVSGWDVSNVTNMYAMFHSCRKYLLGGISGWDVSKVTTMSHMFFNCYFPAGSYDFSTWDTSSVTNMYSMFESAVFYNVPVVDLTAFDVSNVTDMGRMFRGPAGGDNSYLTAIDLSGWDTSSVTNMGSMFQDRRVLTTIYASPSFVVDQVTSSGYMFYRCAQLVGGAGTTYDSSYIDKTRAKIDGGTSDPGYFTAKP